VQALQKIIFVNVDCDMFLVLVIISSKKQFGIKTKVKAEIKQIGLVIIALMSIMKKKPPLWHERFIFS